MHSSKPPPKQRGKNLKPQDIFRACIERYCRRVQVSDRCWSHFHKVKERHIKCNTFKRYKCLRPATRQRHKTESKQGLNHLLVSILSGLGILSRYECHMHFWNLCDKEYKGLWGTAMTGSRPVHGTERRPDRSRTLRGRSSNGVNWTSCKCASIPSCQRHGPQNCTPTGKIPTLSEP